MLWILNIFREKLLSRKILILMNLILSDRIILKFPFPDIWKVILLCSIVKSIVIRGTHWAAILIIRVLLSCGLQESACGPHGLPTDSLFLTNMRTPIIFFPSCYKLFVCCCQTAGLLLHKSGSPQQQTNMRTPNSIFLKWSEYASPCILLSLCWLLHYC